MEADKLSYSPCDERIMRSIIFFIIKLKCNYGKYSDYFIKQQKELQAAQKENLFGRNCPEVAHGHSSPWMLTQQGDLYDDSLGHSTAGCRAPTAQPGRSRLKPHGISAPFLSYLSRRKDVWEYYNFMAEQRKNLMEFYICYLCLILYLCLHVNAGWHGISTEFRNFQTQHFL